MNREQLKRLMKKHGWTMENVAAVAEVSTHTVRAWLRPSTSRASRNMRPQAAILLIQTSEKTPKVNTRSTRAANAAK